LLDGAELADASGYQRVVFIFDGRDAEALARARAQWQAARDSGHAVSYWQQDADGRWQQKA
jgi:DNA polymerase-3 subunit chi